MSFLPFLDSMCCQCANNETNDRKLERWSVCVCVYEENKVIFKNVKSIAEMGGKATFNKKKEVNLSWEP